MKGGRGGSKKKATSKSAKAGLTFPVARIGKNLRTMRLAKQVLDSRVTRNFQELMTKTPN